MLRQGSALSLAVALSTEAVLSTCFADVQWRANAGLSQNEETNRGAKC